MSKWTSALAIEFAYLLLRAGKPGDKIFTSQLVDMLAETFSEMNTRRCIKRLTDCEDATTRKAGDLMREIYFRGYWWKVVLRRRTPLAQYTWRMWLSLLHTRLHFWKTLQFTQSGTKIAVSRAAYLSMLQNYLRTGYDHMERRVMEVCDRGNLLTENFVVSEDQSLNFIH